jgi:hypothetical protein
MLASIDQDPTHQGYSDRPEGLPRRARLYLIHAFLNWSFASTTGLRILEVDNNSLQSGVLDVQNAANEQPLAARPGA